MTANSKFTAQALQDMIQKEFDDRYNRYESIYNTEMPGKSPNDVSFDKGLEIYAMLATPLKNRRHAAMKEAAASCFKDKWMDDAVPNPY